MKLLQQEITDASQLRDVPAGSVIVFPVLGGVQVMTWDGFRLNGDVRIDEIPQLPEKVIRMYGPLTLVATP